MKPPSIGTSGARQAQKEDLPDRRDWKLATRDHS